MKTQAKKIFLERLSSRQAWALLIGYVSITVAVGLAIQHYVDQESLRSFVSGYGSWGPFLFLLIEYVYVLFVPIYNTPIHLAAGYIFGGSRGWLINFVATTGALFTIVALVKYYGRPLLNRVVSERTLNRYERFVGSIGPIALFVVYVLPLFPDDEITYMLAASERVRFWRFIAPIVLGNVTKAAVSYIGDRGSAGIATALSTRVVILVIGLILISAQEYLIRERQKIPSS